MASSSARRNDHRAFRYRRRTWYGKVRWTSGSRSSSWLPNDEARSLSPDGKRVVFLRKLGEEPSQDGVTIPDNRVMLLDLASRKTTEIGRNGVCVSLWAPKFALTTKKMSLLSRGTLCALPITAGRHRGNFLVPESNDGDVAVEKHWVVDKGGVVVRRFPNNPLAEVWSACDELRDRARAEAIFKSL